MGDVVKPEEVSGPPQPVASGVAGKAGGNPPRGTATRRGRGGSSAEKGASAARREVTYRDCTFNISGVSPEVACALLNANAPRKKPSTPRAKKPCQRDVGRGRDTTAILTKMCDDLLRDADDSEGSPYRAGTPPLDQDSEKRTSETGSTKRRSPTPHVPDEYEVLAEGFVQTQQPSEGTHDLSGLNDPKANS